MQCIRGKYGEAVIFTDRIEDSAREQLQLLCDQSFIRDSKIRIMPDVHAGTGCVIGFTADLGEKVIPNIVGVDIGCGMLTVKLGKRKTDFAVLDEVIRRFVPCGRNVHDKAAANFPALQELRCFKALKSVDRIEKSLGTLGGGNHFIEVDTDNNADAYLVIHTGSRNLGVQVAQFYQEKAIQLRKSRFLKRKEQAIRILKEQGCAEKISETLAEMEKDFRREENETPPELCYLTDKERDDYLFDMQICQKFASENRKTIAETIVNRMFSETLAQFICFETVHNYIDGESNIVRKGAVSAKEGERLLIPINMRDGSLLCVGKGNADWNCSAPHGAGRLFSRGMARQLFTVREFQEVMKDVYSTSVNECTLDESPMAYKSMDDIVANIAPTASIEAVIKPVYNFKAGE